MPMRSIFLTVCRKPSSMRFRYFPDSRSSRGHRPSSSAAPRPGRRHRGTRPSRICSKARAARGRSVRNQRRTHRCEDRRNMSEHYDRPYKDLSSCRTTSPAPSPHLKAKNCLVGTPPPPQSDRPPTAILLPNNAYLEAFLCASPTPEISQPSRLQPAVKLDPAYSAPGSTQHREINVALLSTLPPR